MNLDSAMKNAIASVPECVAGGYVDLCSGMLLSISTVNSHPTQVIELLAAATSDLFQGQNVTLIEKLFNQARGIQLRGRQTFKAPTMTGKNEPNY